MANKFERAYRLALEYAQEREQFFRPVAEFQELQWILADMSMGLAAPRTLIRRAAVCPASEFPDVVKAAHVKVFGSKMAPQATNDALKYLATTGYSRAHPLKRMVRDLHMLAIGGGTAQIHRTQVVSRILGKRLPQTRNGPV